MQSCEFIKSAESFVRLTEEAVEKSVHIFKEWKGNVCLSRVINDSNRPVRIKEVVLFKGNWPFGRDTKFYGEGYSMLAQYGGTFESPVLIGGYDDRKHYRLPSTEGFFTVYNFVILSPKNSEHILMGFTSCRRFTSELRLGDGHYEIVLDGENLVLEPGQMWDLEEFYFHSFAAVF